MFSILLSVLSIFASCILKLRYWAYTFMVFMFFWWNDSLSLCHFSVYLWQYLSGSHTSFLILKFSKVQLSPLLFPSDLPVSVSVIPLVTEKMSTVIRGPTESWSGPELHLSSYPDVLTPTGPRWCFLSDQYHPVLSPRNLCHLQRFPYSRREEHLDISRLQDLARMTLSTFLNSCGYSPLRQCPPATLTSVIRLSCVG